MFGAAWSWFRSRVPINEEVLRHMSAEPVAGHLKRWWWCLGGTPLYLFLLQVLTGIILTFYYIPNPEHAYESVRTITQELPYGWYLRSFHKWGSNLMIVAVLLHMIRVYFSGAYRNPRELNWVVGCMLLFVTLGFGFTGYSLLWEQLSYWGITVAGNILRATPLMGDLLADFMRGGQEVGTNTLTRFYVFHIGILPTVLIGFLVVHVYLIRTHGVSQLEGERSTDQKTFPFFPDHFLTELAIGAFLMFLISCLAVIFPAHMGPEANPLVTPEHIKPEWYFFWAFRWLKLMTDTQAVMTQGVFMAFIVIWPFIDGWIRKRWSRSEISIYVGIAVILYLLGLTVWEALYLLHG